MAIQNRVRIGKGEQMKSDQIRTIDSEMQDPDFSGKFDR